MPDGALSPGSDPEPAATGLPRRDVLFILLFVVIAIVAIGLLWSHLPQLLVTRGDYPDAQSYADALNDTRSPLGVLSAAILAAAAAGIGVVVNNHNARLTRESTAVARRNSDLTRESIEVTRQALQATERRDEQTHARERARTDEDRFSKAVEMLGDPAAPVRVGALHILHRLAVTTPERAHLVMDVLCAYLRQPFHHPGLDHDPDGGPGPELAARAWWPADDAARDRRDEEHEVRRTALRLVLELLPPAGPRSQDSEVEHAEGGGGTDTQAPDGAQFLVDLTGAALDELRLTGKAMAALHLQRAYVAGGFELADTRVTGDVRLDGAHVAGGVTIARGARVAGELSLGDGTHVAGNLWLSTGRFPFERDGGTAEVRDLRLGSAHVLGGVYLRTGARVEQAVVLDGTRVEGNVWLDDGATVGHNVLLRDGTDIGGDVRVGQVRVGGALSIEGPDTCLQGDLLVKHGAEIRRGVDVSCRHIGGRVDVTFTELGDTVGLYSAAIAGDVSMSGSSSGGFLRIEHTQVSGSLRVRDSSVPRRELSMDTVDVRGRLDLSTTEVHHLRDVTWSGEGDRELPRNVEAVELPTGGYALELRSHS